jgi:hypothetical protein
MVGPASHQWLTEGFARNHDWITWSRPLRRASTYGQAFIAVDFLIEEKGLPAVIEYFRLIAKTINRERNFVVAFGESLAQIRWQV